MADRTYRSGRDRYDRDRSYSRQAEQYDAAGFSRRDDERGYGQMGDVGRDEDYGQFDAAGQSYSRDPSYAPRGEFATPRYTAEQTFDRGAGSPSPGREHRDHRGTSGGIGRDSRNERGFLERAGDTIAHWLGDDADYGRGERGYRGHGPSGYNRSDERILEDACDCLTEDWGVDARQISLTVTNGEVTLDGTVPTRQQKRRAEDVIDDLSGVKHVQNNLRVLDSTAWDRNNSGEFGSKSNPTSSEA